MAVNRQTDPYGGRFAVDPSGSSVLAGYQQATAKLDRDLIKRNIKPYAKYGFDQSLTDLRGMTDQQRYEMAAKAVISKFRGTKSSGIGKGSSSGGGSKGGGSSSGGSSKGGGSTRTKDKAAKPKAGPKVKTYVPKPKPVLKPKPVTHLPPKGAARPNPHLPPKGSTKPKSTVPKPHLPPAPKKPPVVAPSSGGVRRV